VSGPTNPSSSLNLSALLARYRPVVAYDSLESFFADSAAILTDRPGNLLKRRDGTVLAAATPPPGTPQLELDFLGAARYANGESAADTDYVEEVGSDYVAQAHQMHAIPRYANCVHGRVASDSTGVPWLQYWFFMYYDNPNMLGFGTHQGDLEMIQLRLDASGRPREASYSQHRSGLRADWDQLELAATADGPVPVTYSARGSHANLLRAGVSVSERSFAPDHNDGRGPRVRPDLVVLSDTQALWALWPGSWGGTRASGVLGDVGIDANSPTSPTRHLAWHDPVAFHGSCEPTHDLPEAGAPVEAPTPAPPAPQLSVERGPESTVVRYRLPTQPGSPAAQKIVVGLAPSDGSAPAVTMSGDVHGTSGTLELPPMPEGAGPYEIRATSHDETGHGSETARASMTAA
jgi:hypothetical protein